MINNAETLEKTRKSGCERSKRYRLRHPEKVREYNTQYKREHREKLRIDCKAYKKRIKTLLSEAELEERKKRKREYNKAYRAKNLERIKKQQKEYREKHKEERRLYDKLRWKQRRDWRRQKRLFTPFNGKLIRIKGVLKRPYPKDSKCELCNKIHKKLGYHHWDDTEELLKRDRSDENPFILKGIWACQPCQNFIHRLTEFPYLAEAWFAQKQIIEETYREEVTYPAY